MIDRLVQKAKSMQNGMNRCLNSARNDSPVAGNIMRSCSPKYLGYNSVYLVVVSGLSKEGHALLKIGNGPTKNDSGFYFHIDADNNFCTLLGGFKVRPKVLDSVSFRRYLSSKDKKILCSHKLQKSPREVISNLELLSSTVWSQQLIRHNCLTFVEEVCEIRFREKNFYGIIDIPSPSFQCNEHFHFQNWENF